MNRPLRVLLIGRHFWPHGSIDSASFLIQLASGLRRHGVHAEVCTPRYAASWPEKCMLREIPVHRPAVVPRSEWTMGRYVRHLTTWLRQNAKSFDLLMVDAIREEATAAIEASRSIGCATLLRSSGWGRHSDPRWWQSSRGAGRCGTIGKMADAVIAKSAVCHRALLADRYAASRIHRIDDGFVPGTLRSPGSRHTSRKVLGSVNSDLRTESDTPVVLCHAPMTRDGGVNLLVEAARLLIARYPDLRLWFVGDGPHRDWIYEQLRNDGVRASIAMPGSFCDSEDLFSAADLYLQTDDVGLDHFLRLAVSSELPIVSIDSESTRAVLGGSAAGRSNQNPPNEWVEWIREPTSKQLRCSVLRALDDLPIRREHASQLRRHLLRTRPQSATIDAYITLMHQLAERKSGAARGSSVEAIL